MNKRSAVFRTNLMPNMSQSEDKVIMNMINLSVILLGTLGIILNGFSLFVLWKCMTTGQLGIKLVLFSDLVVCVAYVISNIQHNITNSITLSLTTIMLLVTVNRLTIQIVLFVSNWWIIAILILRTLTILLPKYVNSWNKMVYHKLVYMSCWMSAILIIVPLRFHERYKRVIIYVLPVVLVSLEAGLIIYLIRKLKSPKLSPTNQNNNNTQKSNYRETASSSSTSNVYLKMQTNNPQQSQIKYPKPYNNIVLTILTLALNYLILDCLQFIDALYHLGKFSKEPLPIWFMLLINIFSLLKRIFNFLILCVKCRYFRKIMVLKLSIIGRRFQRGRHVDKRNGEKKPMDNNVKCPLKEINQCLECHQKGVLSRKKRLLSESHVVGKLFDRGILSKNDANNDSYVINSYYSAFEVIPFMSRSSYPSNKHVLSTRY